MEKMCVVCNKLFREGDEVEVLVRTTYHILKSKIAGALDMADMVAIPETIVHITCAEDEENFTAPEIHIDESDN